LYEEGISKLVRPGGGGGRYIELEKIWSSTWILAYVLLLSKPQHLLSFVTLDDHILTISFGPLLDFF
jgi:hypothetical protein